MVNFVCNLTELNYAQRAGKTLFLGVSLKVFPEEISVWINRLSKEELPRQCEPAPSNLLRAWKEQKGRGRMNLPSLLELEHLSSFTIRHQSSWFSGLQTLGLTPVVPPISPPLSGLWPWAGSFTIVSPGSQAFGLRLNYTTGFLVLRLADGRQWDFSASITVWANFYNESILVLFLWRTLTNTAITWENRSAKLCHQTGQFSHWTWRDTCNVCIWGCNMDQKGLKIEKAI